MLLVPPPFDPDLAAALAAVGPSAPSGLSLEEITALHAGPDIAVPVFDLTQDGAFVTTDRTAPGPEGAPDVSLFVATPAAPPQDGQPRPVIYHAHGGGMILGNNRAGVEVVLEWATELDAIVVSVEYRLAPEHPYPAGVEDVYAGLLWTARHVAEFGGDPERIVVAGASAGGGLTAALALLSRDRGGPRAIGQVLMYPMLDDRNDTPSAYQMAGVGAWDRTANETAWTAVLGDARGGPDVPSYAAPAGPPTSPGCRRPSSTSAPRRPSGTRSSTTRLGSGRPAASPNCTCGRAASTASTPSPRTPRSPAPPAPRGSPGCADSSHPDRRAGSTRARGSDGQEAADQCAELLGVAALVHLHEFRVGGSHGVTRAPLRTRLGIQPVDAAGLPGEPADRGQVRVAVVRAGVAEHEHGRPGPTAPEYRSVNSPNGTP